MKRKEKWFLPQMENEILHIKSYIGLDNILKLTTARNNLLQYTSTLSTLFGESPRKLKTHPICFKGLRDNYLKILINIGLILLC